MSHKSHLFHSAKVEPILPQSQPVTEIRYALEDKKEHSEDFDLLKRTEIEGVVKDGKIKDVELEGLGHHLHAYEGSKVKLTIERL